MKSQALEILVILLNVEVVENVIQVISLSHPLFFFLLIDKFENVRPE